MILIKNIDEAKKYIEDRRFEIFLERLKIERGNDIRYEYLSAEIALSNTMSSYGKLEKGIFDDYTLDLKEKTLLKIIKEYPNGVKINTRGGMCPIQ